MPNERYLYERLTSELGRRTIEKTEVPSFLPNNLNPKFGLRPYQITAFQYFINYWEEDFEGKPRQNHQLLFHMATGSGKTLMMAGLILYLYQKGYRNFLFFVNSNNIIEKTKDNFLNSLSVKYLFAQNISIVDKQIQIKEVDNFQTANPEDINIVFSTIQGLHTRLNTPQENSITYEDFENKRIVLISDEAHHINADTRKGKRLAIDFNDESRSWENTVERIFKADESNILLEFTATAELLNAEIAAKYTDKLLFDYSLKQFRRDGYSKEVKVLQADFEQFDRALFAVILSQYRRKIFEKNKLQIKPVILFKSKTIADSKDFFYEFAEGIRNLKVDDLKKIATTNAITTKAFRYFEEHGITLENLIIELKEDFAETKLIAVNSKEESESKQIAVNTLEDPANEYRAIFTVNMLNEGWDVLNLFDIVRLYDTRDAKNGQPGKTTISEAQLIGRGARYCPFSLSSGESPYMRKFDDDIENELRICEELYYHCFNEPRYVSELNTALVEIGIKAPETKERHLQLKENFKQTHLYKAGLVFINEQVKYRGEDIYCFDSSLIDKLYKVTLRSGYTKESLALEKQDNKTVEKKSKDILLKDLGINVIRKALNRLDFYRFSNIQTFLPNLKSVYEFIISDNYLGKIKVEVSALPQQLSNLSQEDKLQVAVSVLNEISINLSSEKIEYKGTKEFKPFMIKDKFKDKTLSFSLNDSEDKETGIGQNETLNLDLKLDLSQRDWYVYNENYGTSEEKHLVKYIDKVYELLKSKYDQIYLVRNERFFKIYNFIDGRPTEPDFVLFLANENQSLYYQIFIEPKGGHLLKQDEWKEKFLISLKEEHQLEQLWKGRKYIVWGMPFFNSQVKMTEFESSFNELIK